MLEIRKHKRKLYALVAVMMFAMAIILGACTALGETDDSRSSGKLPFSFDISLSPTDPGIAFAQLITSETDYSLKIYHEQSVTLLEAVNGVYSLEVGEEYSFLLRIITDNDLIYHTGKISAANTSKGLSAEVSGVKQSTVSKGVSKNSSTPGRGSSDYLYEWDYEPNNEYWEYVQTYEGWYNYGEVDVFHDDADWFRITFTATGTADFWLEDMNNGSVYIDVYSNPNGQPLVSGGGNFPDDSLQCSVTSGQSYYIKITPATFCPSYTLIIDAPVSIHICTSFNDGPYYNITHTVNGHEITYKCSAGCGASQSTGYTPYHNGCVTCNPVHPPHNYGNGPIYGPHTSSGHEITMECTCGASQFMGYTSWPLNGCFECNHTCNSFGDPEYGSHTANGHLTTYYCLASGCQAPTVTGYTFLPDTCTICHSCTPGSWQTDSAHPHAVWRWQCTKSICPNGNSYSGKDNNGQASWNWQDVGGPSGTHNSTYNGHAQSQKCSYSGCSSTQTVYVAGPGCMTCDPHTHTWVNNGSPSGTHTSGLGHAQQQKCSRLNCTATQTVYVALPDTCTSCHSCTVGSWQTDSAHPHNIWRWQCTKSICPNGKNSQKDSNGQASWSWQNNGSPSGTHTSGQGHAQQQKCSYSGCTATQTVYVALPDTCTTCHTCTPGSWQTDSAHPHNIWRWQCISVCPSGKTTVKDNNGQAVWSWQHDGNPNPIHTSGQGHSQPQKCSYSGCNAMNPNPPYVLVASCSTCYPNGHTWQSTGIPNQNHISGQGHEQTQVCLDSGCTANQKIYVPLSSCLICNEITIQRTVVNGQEYDFVISAENITSFNGFTYTFKYDTTKFTLVDACALTLGKDITTGLVSGTDITIISINTSTGTIVFKSDKVITSGQSFTGVVNIIKLKAIGGGSAWVSIATN